MRGSEHFGNDLARLLSRRAFENDEAKGNELAVVRHARGERQQQRALLRARARARKRHRRRRAARAQKIDHRIAQVPASTSKYRARSMAWNIRPCTRFRAGTDSPSHHKAGFSGKKRPMDFAVPRHPLVQLFAVLMLALGFAAPSTAHAQSRLCARQQCRRDRAHHPAWRPDGAAARYAAERAARSLAAVGALERDRPAPDRLRAQMARVRRSHRGRRLAPACRRVQTRPPHRFRCRTAIISCIAPWGWRA